MDRNEFINKLNKFGLPKSEYMILSGGSLLIRGLREETSDFDLCVSEALAKELDIEHCARDEKGYYVPFDNVQMTDDLGSRPFDLVDGFKCETLESILASKKKMLRPKDIKDIARIEAFLKGAVK